MVCRSEIALSISVEDLAPWMDSSNLTMLHIHLMTRNKSLVVADCARQRRVETWCERSNNFVHRNRSFRDRMQSNGE